MGMNKEFNYRWEGAVQIRTCPYLNNIVEQDHRRVKSRVGPMLGCKRFFNARRVVAGVELVQKIVKGQFDVPASFGTDPLYMVQHAGGVNPAPICNRSPPKKAISDGYSGLKALISKKFVGQSDVTDAIEKLQAHSHFGRLDIILNSSRVRT